MLDTLPSGQRWPFLWKMISRYYTYFQAIDYGSLRPAASDFDLQDIDVVFSFFILCFHLKDWIIKEYPEKKELVEHFVVNSKVNDCRAIANGIKHLNSAGPDFPDSKVSFIAREGDRLRISVKYIVESNGKTEDAFTLARECMELWVSFLNENIVMETEAGPPTN